MGLCRRWADHTWGRWTQWVGGAYQTRSRGCKVCGEVEVESRYIKK